MFSAVRKRVHWERMGGAEWVNKDAGRPSNVLRIICNVISFPDAQILSFCLTRKTYPKFCQLSTMECVIKTLIAEKTIAKEW